MALIDRYSPKVRRQLLKIALRQHELGRNLSFSYWRLMASEALHEGANAKLVLPLLSYIFSQIEIEELE